MHSELPRGLYGMVDLARRTGIPAGRLALSLLHGGARVLQLRMKGASAAAMLAVVDELRVLLRRFPGTRLIINDRLDVALAGGADGVHLGQTDIPLLSARTICPPGFVIGISTHNEEQAEAAVAHGADYIALGPIYPTGTKENPDPVVGIERLSALCKRIPVPVVAIGGITLDRVPEVVAAGARAAALIAAVNRAPDIREAAAQVDRHFRRPPPAPP